MVYSEDLSEEKVEYTGWQYKLPESDKMESERDSLEHLILLYRANYFLSYRLWFKNRENA